MWMLRVAVRLMLGFCFASSWMTEASSMWSTGKDAATVNATAFDLGPYANRSLRGDVHIGLKSSNGAVSNITITQIAFIDV